MKFLVITFIMIVCASCTGDSEIEFCDKKGQRGETIYVNRKYNETLIIYMENDWRTNVGHSLSDKFTIDHCFSYIYSQEKKWTNIIKKISMIISDDNGSKISPDKYACKYWNNGVGADRIFDNIEEMIEFSRKCDKYMLYILFPKNDIESKSVIFMNFSITLEDDNGKEITVSFNKCLERKKRFLTIIDDFKNGI